MNRKNILLFLLSAYSVVGIVSLIYAFDMRIVTASLSYPERKKTESVSETETVLWELLKLKTVKADENKKEPVYTYTAVHSAGRLFIRSGPSLENQIISFMRPGTTGDVVSVGDAWVLLQYGDIEGYVFKGYLKLTEVE